KVEVRRRIRLIGGHDLDERLLAHGLQGVIGTALLTERGKRFFAERLAAERPGAMCGVDQALIRKPQQLVVQGIVEHGAEVRRRPAEGGAKVRAADVADEQRVASEYGVRRLAALGGVVNEY